MRDYTLLHLYNKNILDIRNSTYNNVSVDEYTNFIKLLGYKIYRLDNYTFGYRYYYKPDNTFNWMTLNNDNPYVNSFTRSPFKLGSKYNLQKHFLSHKGRKIPKRFTLSEEEKNEYKQALINIQKIDQKTFGAVRDENNILWLDLDNKKDGINPLKKLKIFLNTFNLSTKDILFAEQNYFKGGLHIFFKFNHKLTNNYCKEIETYFRNKGYDYEFNFSNKFLRLPCSYEYIPIKLTEKDLESDIIIDDNRFVKLDMKKFYDKLNKPSDFTNLDSVLNPIKYINLSIEQERKNYWKDYWKNPRNIFIKNKNETNKKHNPLKCYDITKGNRWELTKKIVPWGAAMGLSVDEIADMILDSNIDSKDLPKMGRNGLLKQITPFYNKCFKNVDRCYKPSNFISNAHRVSDFQKICNNNYKLSYELANQLYLYMNEKRNQHHTGIKHINEEKIRILALQLPYYIQEIIGKFLYDLSIDKKLISGFKLPKGIQLSDTYIKNLQDEVNNILNLNNNKYAKTNIQYLKYGLIKLFGLKEVDIYVPNFKKNYVKGSCKVYTLKNRYDVNTIICRLLNLVSHYILPIEQIIYYILLEQNNQIETILDRSCLKEFYKHLIKPPD